MTESFVQSNPLSVLPNTYFVQLNAGENVNNLDFGNWIPFDVVVNSFTANGKSTITVNYEVFGATGQPFELSFYRSTEPVQSANDELLDSIVLNDPTDYLPGSHSKSFTLGSGDGQVRLPGAGADDRNEEYYLLVVAKADAATTNNTALFQGVYHSAGSAAYVHGQNAADSITIAPTSITVNGITYSYSSANLRGARVWAYGGDDVINASTIRQPVWIYGGAGADLITGGKLADLLVGGADNDTINGSTGNDTYLFDADTQLGLDSINDSGGVDTIDYSATTTRTVYLSLATTDAQFVNDNSQLILASASIIDNAIGGVFDDILTGNSLANRLSGGEGNDLLQGAANHDVLVGGSGDDSLVGGSGNDVFSFDTDSPLGSDSIDESGGGTDTLDFSATLQQSISIHLGVVTVQVINSNLSLQLTGAAHVENVVGGARDDVLAGNQLANAILGGLGNDTINGGGGRDLLVGGSNVDVFSGGLGDDILIAGKLSYFDEQRGIIQLAAINAILKEWKRTSADYASRISNLMHGGGVNGIYRLNSSTVSADASASDQLFGDEEQDWFLISVEDVLNDQQSNETVTVV